MAGAILQAMAQGVRPTPAPLQFLAYPNVGALQGDVLIVLAVGDEFEVALESVGRMVLGGVSPSRVRLFAVDGSGDEVTSLERLRLAAARGGVFASDGPPLRRHREGATGPPGLAEGKRRYDPNLVGGSLLRVDATDPELPRLLHCSVPVVIAGSGVVGEATELWNFDYLDRHLSDVDQFFVLVAPAESRGRFAYYDLTGSKNPCDFNVTATNERVEMRFNDFRRKASAAWKKRQAGKATKSFYMQNAVLHREEREDCPPRPVGGFGESCGLVVAKDIERFRWDWLKQVMGRNVQITQMFCGTGGDFSPCHYDPQDNIFVQVRGYKRVLLFHPRHFGCLYPWPVHHPQDRQSRVDFDAPDLAAFPRFAELNGCGLEAILGPGDALHIPPGWWHHIEMLPSPPEGEVVSINFWYPPPQWYYGNPALGDIRWDRPLGGIKRVLFMRCIEELIGRTTDPAEVLDVVRMCAGALPMPRPGTRTYEAVEGVQTFVSAIFPDADEQKAMLELVAEGRFQGLKAGPRRSRKPLTS